MGLCVDGGSVEVNYVLLRLLSRARNLCIYKFQDMGPVYSGCELYQNQHGCSDVTHCCTYNLPFYFPCYVKRVDLPTILIWSFVCISSAIFLRGVTFLAGHEVFGRYGK